MKINDTRGVIKHTAHFIKGSTLDFGAGNAKYKGLIAPLASQYTAFDMYPGNNIDVVGDVLKPPFESNSFDTVVSTQVLEHVERPWIMVGEIARILKPGGLCIATAPFIIPYHADPGDYFRYTKEGLQTLFESVGLELVEKGSYGGFFAVLSEMVHFSWFDPYNKNKNSAWSARFMRYTSKAAYFLDRFVEGRIIYPNSYVVMRKK